MSELVTLRPARPDEIDAVVAIDDDASTLYAEAGLEIRLEPSHPFAQAERQRWIAAMAAGELTVAEGAGGALVGFAARDTVDGAPYLDQLSVRRAHMRLGIGRRLLADAITATRAAGELWLNTYAHLPFNRDFYERHGFRVVPEAELGPEMREILREQRAVLPAPDERVAMVRRVM